MQVGSGGGKESASDSDYNRVKIIRRAKFTDGGFGTWQMDIPDIGGGAVNRETGTSRAFDFGFMPNQNVYSAQVWTYDANGTPTVTDIGMFDKRNQAQKAIKDALMGNARTRINNSRR